MKRKVIKLGRSLKAKIFRGDTLSVKKSKDSLHETAKNSGYSGSSYNAKGTADHGKIISNRKRR